MTSAHGRGDIADLVQRARDGDRAALEELLAAVQDDVHRLTLRMTGCPETHSTPPRRSSSGS
jgi:hypothetical protein